MQIDKTSDSVPSLTVVSNYARMITQVKANRLLKDNIDAMLRERGQSRRDLAEWCHKSESWISKIFSEERREFQVSQLDRIADFFGLDTYRLFQPGVARVTERRKGDRRAGQERRIGVDGRMASHLQSEVNKFPRLSRRADYDLSALPAPIRAVIEKANREIAAIEAQIARGQTASPRRRVAGVSADRGSTRGRNPETPK